MVTAVTDLSAASAALAQPATQNQPQLSDFAQRALDGLGQMHSDYQSGSMAIRQEMDRPVAITGSGPEMLSQQIEAMRSQSRMAIQVQQQIVQFTLATSVSSSLGNNLNSFLKGA
ncbi:hypothetical protein [Paracoccus marinus]|uniref:hypothetical protein n=1 Tax=Paracoccus marinus TaxID=288426 RepID=UPI00103B4C3F|nr:hypothetical protein [Paracoccus marinus]GLS81606.1 hypothetical protein GCM10007893_24220 [Paracoccus marinus]